jgi:MOSC domain-containing protein
MNATVASLFVYPVKSCRGIALSTALLTERGIAHDREWLIVDADGRFISQREVPRLALIVPVLSDRMLELAAPGLSVAVPLDQDHKGKRNNVTVWRDTLPAIDQGDDTAAALSAWIGRPVRLVRFDPAARRYCNPDFAGAGGAHHSFADGYPVLVVSDASLAELNRRLATPLPIDRFRPNLLLSGIDAHDEDHIDQLTIGSVTLKLVKPCTRCQITTTDQSTAQVGIEPLPTLAGYRYNTALDGVTFGMNAIVAAGAGAAIGVGAAVNCTLNF